MPKIYKALDSNYERHYKERNTRRSRWRRIEWTCKDLLKPKKQKKERDEDYARSSR